jgi:hypothetical protein
MRTAAFVGGAAERSIWCKPLPHVYVILRSWVQSCGKSVHGLSRKRVRLYQGPVSANSDLVGGTIGGLGCVRHQRTSIDLSGPQLSKQMPRCPLGRMDDEELAAVYEYLTHLPGF